MPTLADLVQELRELDIGLSEIQIPYRLYRQIIDYAEELAETEEADFKV
jgi:hypothetical protein